MPRSTFSILSAVALAATVSVTPVLAAPQDEPPTPSETSPAAVDVSRLAGDDRYGTAAAIAGQWSTTGQRVYIVSGQEIPDAMVAASRAGVFDAPVLLAKADHLPSETVAALERLQPESIVVVGGQSAVSDEILADLAPYAGSEGVERLSGSNRYETSARLAAEYPAGPERVFLVSGEDYPDALTAAAAAGADHEPLLLTKPGELPGVVAEQLQRLEPTEVVVVGGDLAVSDAVATEAAGYTTSGTHRRVAGDNRYETSAAVAKEFSPGVTPGYVASGVDHSDALVVSALAARDEVPVVLTPADQVASSTWDALEYLAPEQIFVAGGPVAIADSVVDELSRAAGAPAPQPPSECDVAPPTGTAFGANAWTVGKTLPEALDEIDTAFGPVSTVRHFSPGIPFAWDSWQAQQLQGRDLVVSFKLHPTQITSGQHDAFFRNWFATAPDDQTIYWSYFHEPENNINAGEYTAAQYRAAWAHLGELFDEACRPNMHSTLILTEWTMNPGSGRDYRTYDAGPQAVDMIAFDPYNGVWDPERDYYITPEALLDHIVEKMELDGRPWGIAEIGSRIAVGDNGTGRAAWLRDIAEYAAERDATFVTYFHAIGNGDWRLNDTHSRTAWREVLQN